MHLNAQSICNKFSELEVFISDELKTVDVFCVTEHFLVEDMLDCYEIKGYRMASSFTRGNRRGGSLIMCRDGVTYEGLSNLLELSVEGVCEVAAVDMKRDCLRVVSVYRPPGASLDVFLGVMDRILAMSVI